MIDEWADDEMAPWADDRPDRALFNARLEAAAREYPSAYMYTIQDGQVAFDDKGTWTEPHFPIDDVRVYRAKLYRDFFQQCCDMFDIKGSGRLVMDMEDTAPHEVDAPILVYQKTQSSRYILLPDIDFLAYGFYHQDQYRDVRRFEDKRAEAIFVGSTTGDLPLTAWHVHELKNARLRAAMFFREHDNVTFSLPNIVQVDSDETYRLIETLGVSGQRMDWRTQLDYRYLLSMDGNGATCSRVYNALSSNCVLVKYKSDYNLFYFRGMKPWQHFIPVERDGQVVAVVNGAGGIALHRRIAEASTAFAEQNLSRIHLMAYTAGILRRYLARFGVLADKPVSPAKDAFLFDTLIHVSNVGGVWGGLNDWASAGAPDPIEGFTIIPGSGFSIDDIAYRGVASDGTVTEWARGNAFCGSKGNATPLYGLEITLLGAAAEACDFTYEARFADGSHLSSDAAAGPLRGGTPLVGFRLHTRRRENRADSSPTPAFAATG